MINAFVKAVFTPLIFLVYTYQLIILELASVAGQGGLCLTWSQTTRTDFLEMILILFFLPTIRVKVCLVRTLGADQPE